MKTVYADLHDHRRTTVWLASRFENGDDCSDAAGQFLITKYRWEGKHVVVLCTAFRMSIFFSRSYKSQRSILYGYRSKRAGSSSIGFWFNESRQKVLLIPVPIGVLVGVWNRFSSA